MAEGTERTLPSTNVFAYGEIAITQGLETSELNGQEVTVVGPLMWMDDLFSWPGLKALMPPAHCYPVRWREGEITFQPFWQLRKKKPPAELIERMREQEEYA